MRSWCRGINSGSRHRNCGQRMTPRVAEMGGSYTDPDNRLRYADCSTTRFAHHERDDPVGGLGVLAVWRIHRHQRWPITFAPAYVASRVTKSRRSARIRTRTPGSPSRFDTTTGLRHAHRKRQGESPLHRRGGAWGSENVRGRRSRSGSSDRSTTGSPRTRDTWHSASASTPRALRLWRRAPAAAAPRP